MAKLYAPPACRQAGSRKVSDAPLAKLFWSFSHKVAQDFVMLAFFDSKYKNKLE
ncbi:MAG: hypothetical protein WC473_02770 [Patescibacteria group bacterium]